ncbi:hypothetical protein [Thermococcus sp. Bubb.Bath]|uniref:hypothetical protein n=1 Tax=Thermococcus sp. Bubb.Bath TaxID=1638242 RepID=UPI00143BE3BD|nr:hypothetical protein [Thermococcus sp. Bubb.Bath]NJF25175.1 hypothetical protein [Thermococcus sp. Bubb.Bath]
MKTMINDCLEYFDCFEYRLRSKELSVSTKEGHELEKTLARRKLKPVLDQCARREIIQFINGELIRRGRTGEASLIRAVEEDGHDENIRVYTNSVSLLVAVRTFSTVSCLVQKLTEMGLMQEGGWR